MRAVDIMRAEALAACLRRAREHFDFLDSWLDDSHSPEISATLYAAIEDIDNVLGDDALLVDRPGPREASQALLQCESALVEADVLMSKGKVRAA